MQTFPTYEDALAACDEQHLVSGTYREPPEGEEFGDPVYFLAPSEADRWSMGLLAFEARTGKPHPDPAYLSWLRDEATA